MEKKLHTKKFIAIAFAIFAMISLQAQTNCYLQIASSSNSAQCPGTPIVLTASTAAVNVGTGATGLLNVTGTVYTDAVRTSVVGANTTGSNNKIRVSSTSGFSVGDEVLCITMQDPNTAASNLVGQYDFATITAIDLDTLKFSSVLTKSYNASGSIKHQVIKVPQYTNITVSSGGILTCNNWNGSTGGVLVFRASGVVTINSGGSINANGKGYRAPTQKTALWRNANGGQGEGIYGTGIASGANGAGPCNNNAAWNNANGNGGGGGTGCGDSGGGGGGGNAAVGSNGVNNGHTPGLGGLATGNTSVTLLYMGGAGGEGGADEDGAYPGTGGNGAGVIFISTNSLVVNGLLQNNGINGSNGSNDTPGGGCGMTAGGGGAGGSTVLQMNSFSGTAANITAVGGTGGLSVGGCNGGSQTGGNGSIGRIRVEIPSGSVATNPAANVVTIPALSGLGYTWSNATTQSTNAISPSLTTVYNVTITSGSSCVGSSAAFTVAVLPSPTLSIAGTTTLCAGTTATLQANGASTYTWTNDNSTSSALSINPTSSTSYTLTGKNSQGCIGNSVVQAVSVYTVPTIAISGNTAICVGDAAVLSATGANTYTWAALSLNSNTVSVNPTATTSYTVSGTSADGCVGNTVLFAVTVNTLPVLSISGSNTLCAGASIVITANGAATYTWVNTSSNSAALNISPSTSQTYSLIGSSTEGCLGNQVTMAVTVYSLPLIAITGTNAICAGNSTTLNANGASSYTWTSDNSNGNSLVVNPTSATTYSLLGSDAQGCVGSQATMAVSVYSLPTLSIAGSNTVCNGGNLVLTANGAASYVWLNNASTVASLSVSPTANTVYTLSGQSAQGCNGSNVTSAVTVYSVPVLSISGTNTLCIGSTRTLTANGASTYTWAGVGSSANSITVSPTTTTNYTLLGSSADGCVGNAAQLSVSVYSLPVVTISGTTAVCAGNSATLVAGGAATYTWLPSNSNVAALSIAPTTSSNYSLTGTSAQGCAGATATLAVTVNTVPVVSISGAATVCAGNSVVLTANGASTYTWTNNNANTSTQTISPTATTIYTLVGTSAAGCVGSASTQTVNVLSIPVLSITGVNAICAGSNAVLTAAGATTYSWNTSATTTTISVAPLSTAVYSLNGVGANGCLAVQKLYTLTVNANPTVSIGGNAVICAGNTASLTASGASTYVWNTSATASTLFISPATTSVYSVVGSFSTGCTNSTAITVTVNVLPVVSIAGNSVICFGNTANLTASGASTYSWNTGAASSSIAVNPGTTTSYSAQGTDANGCKSTAVATVIVNALPVLAINGISAICAGDSVQLSASGANSYTWNTSVTAASIILTPTIASGYNVVNLIGTDNNGCTSTKVDSVLVNAIPSLTISGGNYMCNGQSLVITVGGADSYSWSTGSSSSSITVSPSSTTSYSVIGTNTTGCSIMSVHNVTVISMPVVAITGSTVMCAGETVSLTASGANTYSWSSGATGSVIAISPNTTTTYSVIGEVGVGCSDSTETTVKVNALPVLTLSAVSTTICNGESTNLTVLGASTYSWSTGDNTSSIAVSPTVSTNYSVVGVSTDNCNSQSSIQVEVSECSGITKNQQKSSIVMYPNPVSNKLFVKTGIEENYTIEVINSIGQVIFTGLFNDNSSIDMSSYNNGIYFVKLKVNGGNVYTGTVVKQ